MQKIQPSLDGGSGWHALEGGQSAGEKLDRVCEREEEDGQKDNNWEEGRTQVDHIVSKIHVVIRGVHVA